MSDFPPPEPPAGLQPIVRPPQPVATVPALDANGTAQPVANVAR
jgi:hypothetical protein